MKQKRSQANIIVTILLVLIALTLIAVVSTFVIKIVKENVANADIASRAPDISIEKAEVYEVSGMKMLQLSLQRGSDNENVTGINILVSDGAKVETKRENISFGTGEYRVISWQTTLSDIKNVEIYPIFEVGGREIIGTKVDYAVPTLNSNNGTLCLDSDHDGYNTTSTGNCGIVDCNDNNINVNPGVIDDYPNGLDDNCINGIDEWGLLINGGAESGLLNWSGWTSSPIIDVHSGAKSFYIIGSKAILSTQMIEIESSKTYNLSGWFKAGGLNKSVLLFGFQPLDVNNNRIWPQYVNAVPNSNTTLYSNYVAGSKVIQVVNCSGFNDGPTSRTNSYMAFNVQSDYSDLPNRELSNPNITSIVPYADHCDITFNLAVSSKSYSAGTKVRQHLASSSYIYSMIDYSVSNSTWKFYSNTISGHNLYGLFDGKWWPGTTKVQVLVYANQGQGNSYSLYADDISLKEI